jgi:hypothetical protein
VAGPEDEMYSPSEIDDAQIAPMARIHGSIRAGAQGRR